MGNLIPDDFKQSVKKQCDRIERFKRILSEEEIKQKIGKCIDFYRKHKFIGKIYNDNLRDWIFIQTPERNIGSDGTILNKPIPSETIENSYRWRVVSPGLGEITIWASEQQIIDLGWGSERLVTGKVKLQYKIPNNYLNSLEAVAKALNIPTIDELTEDEYSKAYSINIYQVIE